MAAHLHEVFLRQSGLQTYGDPIGRQRLLEAAEAAKIRLDDEEETRVQVPFLTAGADAMPLGLDTTLSRAQLDRLTRELVERCAAVAGSVLRASRLEPEEMDAVFVYGRQARAPAVVEAITRVFGQTPRRLPEAAAARGAVLLVQ